MSEEKLESLGKGNWLELVRRDTWEFVRNIRADNVVAIAAATDTGEIILIEQYRPAVNRKVIEIPAGLAGDIDADEALETAAARELEEETGYRPTGLTPVPTSVLSAGSSALELHVFVADGVERVGEGGGDGSEDIEVHVVPVENVDTWLEQKSDEGCLIDLRVYGAIHLLRRFGKA